MILAALLIEIVLVVLDVSFVYFEGISERDVQDIFNIAREDSIATWFAATQAFLVGITSGLVFLYARTMKSGGAECLAWLFLAFFFIYVGVDDAVEIHERVGPVITKAFESASFKQIAPVFFQNISEIFSSYLWHAAYAPFFALMALLILWIALRHGSSRAIRCSFVFGLLCYITAVCIDYLEGLDEISEKAAVFLHVELYTVTHSLKLLEESLEMVGTTAFWYGALSHLREITSNINIRLQPTAARKEIQSNLLGDGVID